MQKIKDDQTITHRINASNFYPEVDNIFINCLEKYYLIVDTSSKENLDLRQKLDEKNVEYKKKEELVCRKERDIQLLQVNIENINKKHDQDIKQQKRQLETMQENIVELNKTVEKQKTTIQEINDSTESLKIAITSLQTQELAKQKKIVISCESKIARLENEKIKLQKENAILKQNNDEFNKIIGQKDETIQILHDKINKLNQKLYE